MRIATGIPRRTQPLWTKSRHMQRQLEGWKLLAYILFVAWWWLPTLFVVYFFYYVVKYSVPLAVWTYNYMREWVRSWRSS